MDDDVARKYATKVETIRLFKNIPKMCSCLSLKSLCTTFNMIKAKIDGCLIINSDKD